MFIKLIMYLVLTVSGLILFKLGGSSTDIHFSLSKVEMSLPIMSLIGIIAYGCSFLLWLSIVKENDISYVFPIANGLVTIMTVIGGIIAFGEKIVGMQWIGIICIILGVVLVNLFK